MDRVQILNVPIDPFTMTGAVACLENYLQNEEQALVVTANAEIIMQARKNPEYLRLIQSAQLVTADGAGAVWAGRHLGYKIPERVAGYDLFHRLLESAAKKHTKVFFFGGKPGVAEAAASQAKKLYPELEVVGCRNGYFQEQDNDKIIDEINKSGAQILFAALGAPKQEFWLNKYRKQLKANVLMGIGGSFDVLSGNSKRAPLWMQKAALEWFYRLCCQPARIGRIMGTLPPFVFEVLLSKKKQ